MQQASMGGYTDLTPTMERANGFERAVMDHLRSGVFPELAQVQGSVYRGRDRRGIQLPRIEIDTHLQEDVHDQFNPSRLQAQYETHQDGTGGESSPSSQHSNKRLYYDHTPVEYVPKAPPMRELTLVNKRKSIEQERLSTPFSSDTAPAAGAPAARQPERPSSTSRFNSIAPDLVPSVSVESYETSSDASKAARLPPQSTQSSTPSALAPPPERLSKPHINVPNLQTSGPTIDLDDFIVEAITPLEPDLGASNCTDSESDAAPGPPPPPDDHAAAALPAPDGLDNNSRGLRTGAGHADQLFYPSSQHGTYVVQTTGGGNAAVSTSTRPVTPRIGGSFVSPVDRAIPTVRHGSLGQEGAHTGWEMESRAAQTVSALQLWSAFLNFVSWLGILLKSTGEGIRNPVNAPAAGKNQKDHEQLDDERKSTGAATKVHKLI